jgi:hypothetical protein
VAVEVGLIISRKFRARQKVMPDIFEGLQKCGVKTQKVWAHDYRDVFSDIAIFYGFDGSRDSNITKAFHDYKKAGKKAIYIDLGYFTDRVRDGRYGYHRFSINDRHPTAYFQNKKHKGDRFRTTGRKVMPWRHPGRNIVVCGMSEKCAVFEGFKFEQWERAAIEQIKSVTDRPIVYRPKPRRSTEPQYPPIKGVEFSNPAQKSLKDELENAWAVVSHHSNSGIDALLAGVPCFSDEGVSLALGLSDLREIENPRNPTDEERKQFAADVAYCQFNRAEMRDGTFWRHFKDEGLV